MSVCKLRGGNEGWYRKLVEDTLSATSTSDSILSIKLIVEEWRSKTEEEDIRAYV